MRRNNINILIVDDEAEMREPLGDIFREEGYRVVTVENRTRAQKELKETFFNVALTDLMLPDGTGLDLLEYIKKTNAETRVIVLTGFASLETSIRAINAGAFSYIQKPLNMEEVKRAIKRAFQVQRLSLENKMLLDKLKDVSLKDPLTGLYNYHCFLERVSSEFKRAKRYVYPYRKAYSREDALGIIGEKGRGTQFDPEIVDIFLRLEANRNRKNRGILNGN